MSDWYVGEVRIVGFNFTPWDWLMCNGGVFSVSEYPELAAVLKDTYGGDGVTTFGVPNFNGRTVIGTGQGTGLTERKLNDLVGSTQETLSVEQMPVHSHKVRAVSKCSDSALTNNPEGSFWAKNVPGTYSENAPNTEMCASAITATEGKGFAHNNIQPSICLNYMIVPYPADYEFQYCVGEIRMFAGTTLPDGWHLCDGSLVDVKQYQDLYNLIGITYGGDGTDKFALPDLCGRTIIGASEQYPLGSKGGSETVTLSVNEVPRHGHTVRATSGAGTNSVPGENMLWANGGTQTPYAAAGSAPDSTMNAAALTTSGGDKAHNNMMPSLGLNFMIALTGANPADYYG